MSKNTVTMLIWGKASKHRLWLLHTISVLTTDGPIGQFVGGARFSCHSTNSQVNWHNSVIWPYDFINASSSRRDGVVGRCSSLAMCVLASYLAMPHEAEIL